MWKAQACLTCSKAGAEHSMANLSFPISFLDPLAPTESNPTEPGKGKYDQDTLYENFKE